jgi:hypothetical protein
MGAGGLMITKQDILEHFADRAASDKSLNAYELTARFRCSMKSAAKHLAGLWRGQLIEATKPRPRRFQCRLQPREQLEALRFKLTHRGRRRLQWYHGEDRAKRPVRADMYTRMRTEDSA